MYRFLQKHKRKLLAVFAAFLMIVFILPTTMNQAGGRMDPVVARIGDDEVHASEVQQAENSWRTLTQVRGLQTQMAGPQPLAFFLGWRGEMSEYELVFQQRPPMPFLQISANPRLFFLLKKEAERMGVTVSNDQVQDLLTNQLAGVSGTEEERARIEQAVRDLLLVDAAYRRAASTIKVSEPMRKHEAARQQSISVNLVEFNAADFGKDAPAPTTQQLEQHFAQFADVAKLDPTDPTQQQARPTTNPFGFGYRYPDRVRLQYVSIPRAEVRKVVEASKSAYDWEVAAQKYYQQNLSQFPATQPAAATTQSTLSLVETTTQASTRPTTRPFAEVREDAKSRVLLPEVERKVGEVQSAIVSALNTDWTAYRNATAAPAGGTTKPAPVTSLGVPYASYEYLEKLADRVQQQTKVRPTVASLTDQWYGHDELEAIGGLGLMRTAEGQPFADYVMTWAEPFVPAGQRDEANTLSLWEPTPVFREGGAVNVGDVYIARLTEAQAAHKPAGLAEVADAARQDYEAARRHELAKAEAGKLLDAARQSGLAAAAQASGKTVTATGLFQNQAAATIPGYALPPDQRAAFIAEAMRLLSTPASRPSGQPVALVELPQAGKVLVAELNQVRNEWTPDDAPLRLAGLNQQIREELERYFQIEWFNFDDARRRLGYRAEGESDAETEDASAA